MLRIPCNCPSSVVSTICLLSFRAMAHGWTRSVVPPTVLRDKIQSGDFLKLNISLIIKVRFEVQFDAFNDIC